MNIRNRIKQGLFKYYYSEEIRNSSCSEFYCAEFDSCEDGHNCDTPFQFECDDFECVFNCTAFTCGDYYNFCLTDFTDCTFLPFDCDEPFDDCPGDYTG